MSENKNNTASLQILSFLCYLSIFYFILYFKQTAKDKLTETERVREVKTHPLVQWDEGEWTGASARRAAKVCVSGESVSGEREGERKPARQIHRKHV